MKQTKLFSIVLIFLILIFLIFVSGQQGCEMQGKSSTQAKKTGLDFNLISGVDYIGASKTIQQGESFYVGVHIENYDKAPRSGEVCISDSVSDSFGGIFSQGKGECKSFSIKAADVVKKESKSIMGNKISEEVVPATVDIYFPEEGFYSYQGLPASQQPWPQTLYVSLYYRQFSQITGTINVPNPSYEQINLIQEPAPIIVSVTKSMHRMQDSYKTDLEIILKKQPQVKVFSPDFTKENVVYFSAKLEPQQLLCVSAIGQPITSYVEIENERLIKCSSIVYLAGEVQQSYPLVISLDYGVALQKQYPFGIKTIQ